MSVKELTSSSPSHDQDHPVVREVKPKLRGWIHAGMAPLAIAAGIVLVALAPTASSRISVAIFGFSAMLLFGTSAVYHRGHWSPRVAATLRRIDHTNIFLIIAGSYTPLAVILLPWGSARTLLIIVWSGAVAGLLARIFWLNAPRWFYTPIYVALGWVSMWYIDDFWRSGDTGPAVVWTLMAGGLAYTLGAVVYGTKWPNPSPRWFGFHEVFHSLTVAGYVMHYITVSIAVYTIAK